MGAQRRCASSSPSPARRPYAAAVLGDPGGGGRTAVQGAPIGPKITTALSATPAELAVKRAATAAHESQIGAEDLAGGFAEAYELEWYVRRGAPALLEEAGDAHAP